MYIQTCERVHLLWISQAAIAEACPAYAFLLPGHTAVKVKLSWGMHPTADRQTVWRQTDRLCGGTCLDQWGRRRGGTCLDQWGRRRWGTCLDPCIHRKILWKVVIECGCFVRWLFSACINRLCVWSYVERCIQGWFVKVNLPWRMHMKLFRGVHRGWLCAGS